MQRDLALNEDLVGKVRVLNSTMFHLTRKKGEIVLRVESSQSKYFFTLGQKLLQAFSYQSPITGNQTPL